MIELVDSEPVTEEPVKELDGVVVRWDAENQAAQLLFNPNEFRTWEWVIGLLTMGLERAREMSRVTFAQNLQRQQQAAFEAEALRRNLNLN